jgi:hypothetical protein
MSTIVNNTRAQLTCTCAPESRSQIPHTLDPDNLLRTLQRYHIALNSESALNSDDRATMENVESLVELLVPKYGRPLRRGPYYCPATLLCWELGRLRRVFCSCGEGVATGVVSGREKERLRECLGRVGQAVRDWGFLREILGGIVGEEKGFALEAVEREEARGCAYVVEVLMGRMGEVERELKGVRWRIVCSRYGGDPSG